MGWKHNGCHKSKHDRKHGSGSKRHSCTKSRSRSYSKSCH